MKKLVVLLSFLFLLTGCSVDVVKDSSIDGIIDTVLMKNIKLSNSYFEGYKFYLPRGMKISDKKQYNMKILSDDYRYYLYVDVVAYYNKVEKEFESEDSFYSKQISYKGKKGYIVITEVDDKYFVEIMYNYAKIEILVKEKDLNSAIINSCYILSSVKFNDSVIEAIVGEDSLDYKETIFDIFGPNRDAGEFLEYEKDYGTYKENKEEEINDSDTLKTEQND